MKKKLVIKNHFEQFKFVKILDRTSTNPCIIEELEICQQRYEVWDYDYRYILLACKLANKWPSEQITMKRIEYLRTWLRESAQHSHNLDYSKCRSMEGIRKKIIEAIKIEYQEDWCKNQIPYKIEIINEIYDWHEQPL